MSKDERQTIKQMRGQISALARENEMLTHKMSLLEQNATLKQNEMFAGFLKWMEETGATSKVDGHPNGHERDSESPTALISVKQKPISTESQRRSKVQDDVPMVSRGSTMNKSHEIRNSSFNTKPDNAHIDKSSKKQGASDAGVDQTRLRKSRSSGSPKNMDDHSQMKSTRRKPKHFGGITPSPDKSPFDPHQERILPVSNPWCAPTSYRHVDFVPRPGESAMTESSDRRNDWLRRQDEKLDHAQMRSTPVTSTPKRPNTSSKSKRNVNKNDRLEAKVESLLEETRLAASPDMQGFAAGNATSNVHSRPVTSTPAKTPQKRVIFADEMNENAPRSRGDPVSSVPRPFDCDPLNLFTPGKTPGSSVRQLAYQLKGLSPEDDDGSVVAPTVDPSPQNNCDPLNLFTPGKTPGSAVRQLAYQLKSLSPADDDGFVDSRDERSFRRLTLNDKSDSRTQQRGSPSKRPTSSRKGYKQNISKNGWTRSKSVSENNSAKRDLPLDADEETSFRPSVNVDRLFDSKENRFCNHEHAKNFDYKTNYQNDHASFGGESRSKRSRYEGVTNNSPGLAPVPKSPLQSKSQRQQGSFSTASDISNNEPTIEILENELRDIYKQNLDDEVKITEIRRSAVRRFDDWRNAMENEMVNLEKDGKERLAENLDKLSHSLPACLKCDCSTGFDGNLRSVAVSEGHLSELESGLGSGFADVEKSHGKKIDECRHRAIPSNTVTFAKN